MARAGHRKPQGRSVSATDDIEIACVQKTMWVGHLGAEFDTRAAAVESVVRHRLAEILDTQPSYDFGVDEAVAVIISRAISVHSWLGLVIESRGAQK